MKHNTINCLIQLTQGGVGRVQGGVARVQTRVQLTQGGVGRVQTRGSSTLTYLFLGRKKRREKVM